MHRSFGAVTAVAGMDVVALPGEVTALVGPNGAGKTTLLLMLATLLTPDAGQITVAGHDPVTAPREVRARLGWMPDAFGTYDTLTAREVLEFVAASYRLTPGQSAARARELLALVHLAEFAERPVHVLSRGQKQRLGLARAIVHEPSVLLLDEPASGLDPRSRIELRTIVRDLAATGCTLLVSSHILSELDEMADRAVFVAGGQTVSTTLVSDLRSAPLGALPWRIRALDQPRLLTVLTRRGIDHDAGDGGGAQVSLPGEEAAADLTVIVFALATPSPRPRNSTPTPSPILDGQGRVIPGQTQEHTYTTTEEHLQDEREGRTTQGFVPPLGARGQPHRAGHRQGRLRRPSCVGRTPLPAPDPARSGRARRDDGTNLNTTG